MEMSVITDNYSTAIINCVVLKLSTKYLVKQLCESFYSSLLVYEKLFNRNMRK